jgi:hypothetical protein
LQALRAAELADGVDHLQYYANFSELVIRTRHNLLEFLIAAHRGGKTVAGYGAPGKGNTLLNYCGIRTDLVQYTVDRDPYKQGRFLPGTHIPIHRPDRLEQTRPDYVLVMDWNLKEEMAAQLQHTREWGAQLVVALPKLEIF